MFGRCEPDLFGKDGGGAVHHRQIAFKQGAAEDVCGDENAVVAGVTAQETRLAADVQRGPAPGAIRKEFRRKQQNVPEDFRDVHVVPPPVAVLRLSFRPPGDGFADGFPGGRIAVKRVAGRRPGQSQFERTLQMPRGRPDGTVAGGIIEVPECAVAVLTFEQLFHLRAGGRLLRQQTGTQPGFDQLTFPDLLRSRRHGRKFRAQRTYLQGIEVEFHVAGTPLKSEAKRPGSRIGGNPLREAEPPPRKRFVRNLRLSPALRSIAVPEVELKLDAVVKVVRPGNAGVPEPDRKFDRLPFKTGKPDGSVGGVPAGDFRGVRRNRDRQEFFPGVFRDPAELRLPPLPLRLGGRESGESGEKKNEQGKNDFSVHDP